VPAKPLPWLRYAMLPSMKGYKVIGLAPTSRAAQKLAEAGIESGTLQRHLVRGEQPDGGQKMLYVLDESSLASTKQMNQLLHRCMTATAFSW